ncbi:CHAT domain-containing protein [Streptomyces sp. NPDC048282]|uniref:CHAT domain-containing protein n=1 Tax=Streptomyces sp. NPDC048282 TaxID=3365528 RepID=UPI0037118CBA
MDRGQLIAALDERIDRAAADPTAVLGSPALTEAMELARIDDGGLDIAYTLGMFFHHRQVAAEHLGAAERDDREIAAALHHFRTLYRQAPDLLPSGLAELGPQLWPGEEDLHPAWNSRAVQLIKEGRVRPDPMVVGDGVDLLRRVVAGCDTGSDKVAGYLSNLALALRVRFLMTDEDDDIAEAVEVGRRAVETAVNEETRGGFRSNLAVAYTARFERRGDAKDLDLAVEQLRPAVSGTGPTRAGRLSNLAASLASRFRITGDRGDIDEAIGLFAQAVELAEDPFAQAEYLSNGAAAYSSRYAQTGDTADLGLAVAHGRQAVDRSESLPVLPAMLNNLALALRSQYQRTGEQDVIDESVGLLRRAVAEAPPGGAERPRYLSNLCSALRVRFDHTQLRPDIDEAVERGRQAVASSGVEKAELARYHSNLGAALSKRFAATGAHDDLDAAVAAERRAAELVPRQDPVRATVLANLGLALRRRAELRGTAEDLTEAAQAYHDSAATVLAPPLVRATSAQDCGEIQLGCGNSVAAVTSFEQAIGLIGEVTDSRLVTDDQQHHLTRLAGLGCAAASAALRNGEPVRALALLERGRGILLAQMLAIRSELTDLRDRHEELAEEWEQVQRELNQTVSPAEPWAENRAVRRSRLSEERQRLVDRIRELPGFTDFLLPKIADDLARSPVDGPVVAINVAEHRCDALVVYRSGVRLVPLPDLSRAEATAQANVFLTAVHDRAPDSDERIGGVLHWMWEAFAERILDALGMTDVYGAEQTPPRVWWMPTGALSVLPIHAAGRPGVPGMTVLDRGVSSYTPTLRTLRQAHGQSRPTREDRPLVVAVPEPGGEPPLPGARREAARVTDRLPAGTMSLVDAEATRERVLRELPHKTWAHFACHARTDPANPFDSHLVVHDGDLKVREIAELRVSRATGAYLSACTTAFGGTGLVDEAIHISSAFQLAGYPDVIGTLWRVKDIAAEHMAVGVYAELAKQPPAQALHTTLHRLRQRYARSPYMWASHIHIGP